jgi:hypothetical protein
MAHCSASFTDLDETEHAAKVEAESVCEAVVLAVADFRERPLINAAAAPMTEFTAAVLRNPTEHRIRLQQVSDRFQPSTKGGLAGIGITKRERVRKLLRQ